MDLIENEISSPIQHWYYQHKFWFIKNSGTWSSESSNRLVDIGAGSALFSKELLKLKLVDRVVAVDTGYEAISDFTEGIQYCKQTQYQNFSHFLMTDILEHIKDDRDFLSKIVNEADSESIFIITVPALMCLWSGHDSYLKHFRRYRKSELISLVIESGLEVISVRYTFSSVFPIAYLVRRLSRADIEESQLKKNGPLASFILRLALIPDRWISTLPFGVSLFLEARKA